MQYRIFQYPLPSDPELQELNAYLSSHRVATVDHQIVSTAGGVMLVFIVQTTGERDGIVGEKSTASTRVDYRELLTEEQFAVYDRLRAERKRVAEAEGVVLYAIFTNAQFAEMVTRRMTTLNQIAAIDGIGKPRVEKYARHFLPILADAFASADSTLTDGKEQPK